MSTYLVRSLICIERSPLGSVGVLSCWIEPFKQQRVFWTTNEVVDQEKAMKRTDAALSILILCFATGDASAQTADVGRAETLHKACQTGGDGMMGHMNSGSAENYQGGMMQRMNSMSATQKALHQAMMKMQPAMMEGMMVKDADLAWICAMIPHHQGAIDMARAGLKGADNAESKRLAEETIKSNERDKAKLIDWIEKYAEKENQKATTGPSPKR